MDDPEGAARAAITAMAAARSAIATARANRDAAIIELHRRGMKAAEIERILASIARTLDVDDPSDLGVSKGNIMYVLRVDREARARTAT